MDKRAFTMVEILVVMVMIAMIAAWGVPQYGRALNRARARNAIQNLSIVQSANTLYKARNGKDCSSTAAPGNVCADLDGNGVDTGINNMNGTDSLNIIASGLTYGCGNNAGTCTATDGTLFTVTANLTSGATPACANLTGSKVCP